MSKASPKNSFSRIRRLIENGDVESAREVYLEEREKWKERVDGQIRHIENLTSPQNPADERYLNVTTTEGSDSKLTYAPKTGRVELKVSKKASEQVSEDLIDMATQAKDFFNAPVSIRGKIRFDVEDGAYKVSLISENKRYKNTFHYYVDECETVRIR